MLLRPSISSAFQPTPSESKCALELTSGESLPCFPQHVPSPSPTTMPLLDTKPMLTLSKLAHFEERRVRKKKKQHITISSNTQRKPIITKARGWYSQRIKGFEKWSSLLIFWAAGGGGGGGDVRVYMPLCVCFGGGFVTPQFKFTYKSACSFE